MILKHVMVPVHSSNVCSPYPTHQERAGSPAIFLQDRFWQLLPCVHTGAASTLSYMPEPGRK